MKPHEVEGQVFALVLGKIIERRRQQQSLTQTQLADALSISQPVISRIEAGSVVPDVFLFGRLAGTFGTSRDDLQREVDQAVAAVKKVAETVYPEKSWEAVVKKVGADGVVGLIAFVVTPRSSWKSKS